MNGNRKENIKQLIEDFLALLDEQKSAPVREIWKRKFVDLLYDAMVEGERWVDGD